MRPLLLVLLAVCPGRAADIVSFANQVQPILASRCQMCHSEQNRSGGLAVHNHAALLQGGTSGKAVIAGDLQRSLLLQFITGNPPRMPKAGAPLTPQQVAMIKLWIEQGGKNDAPDKREVWWSLKPLIRPQAPAAGHPIDAFLRAKLQEKGLAPSPEADRRTLIRRLTFDLHGLPPTAEEANAFLNDKSSDAYEKLVDRLLASPRYGERWARHWLDVVHYGDSHGYDKDKPRANAWPYRDYVIRAFNQDKPYKRFVEEQLAGDVLYPDDPDAVVATGFIAAGPWDFVGHQELREGTTDKNITRLLDRDDMVAQTMSTFVSQTVHCARCHNHKFDPIAQEDYYSTQAVFAGIDRADRPYDTDPAIGTHRRALREEKRQVQLKLQPLLDKVENATSDEIERLSSSISDAKSLATHIGEPKTPAEAEQKKEYLARADRDTKLRKQLVDQIVGDQTYREIAQLTEQSKAVDQKLDQLPKPKLVYAAASFFPRAGTFRPALEPRPVFVLNRGSVDAPGKLATPGAIGARFQIPDNAPEGARRAALAQWIVAKDRALTWRSIVNRMWHYHFGSGIVDSPNDFGRMGSQPTHSELLDWLAVWFRDDAQGSFKKLHKLIVTSAAYRQSSASKENEARIDSDNRYLWRMTPRRIEAEALRDAMLLISGKLDLREGGPADRLFWFKDDHSPVYDYAKFDPDDPHGYRRSIYRFIVRSVPDPFMERLDCPDSSLLSPKRSTTLTAIQALAVLNNPFVIRMAEHFAARIENAGDTNAQIKAAYRLALNRDPSSAETKLLHDYTARNGIVNLCRLLFNSNEFHFVD